MTYSHYSNTVFRAAKIAAVILLLMLSACKPDEPVRENTPEMITKVVLTFTPVGGGTPVIQSATDQDGEGVMSITVDGGIDLKKGASYILTISLVNTLVAPTDEGYDVTSEVRTNGDEHMFFFGWDKDAFVYPSGNGNLDARADAVNYAGGSDSLDKNGRPLGLTTTWTTASFNVTRSLFTIVLKHQPGLKSETSDSRVGETDMELTWALNVN